MYGLTGSIATGKSTVAGMLRELGSAVIDADRIAKDVTALGQPGWYEVLKAFPEVVTAEQGIDRKKLAELIFDDRQKRKRLETIIHPLVFAEIKRSHPSRTIREGSLCGYSSIVRDQLPKLD